ncbi:MAG: hypothetical protein GY778_16730, partial [bacterium]|nr:hypothetical protein [bacterium]
MTTNTHPGHGRRRVRLLGPILALALLLPSAAPSLAKPPPAGNTYFTVFVGMEAPFSADADCVKFTKTKMCFSDGTCGPWRRTDAADAGTSFSFEIKYDQDGGRVAVKGKAETEDRGRKDTIGGVGMTKAGGKKFNFALTG